MRRIERNSDSSLRCPALAKLKYRILHDIVDKHIHWLLLKKCVLPSGNKWYNHVPIVVIKRDDGKITIYWKETIKNYKKVSYNRPDVVKTEREDNTWYIVEASY